MEDDGSGDEPTPEKEAHQVERFAQFEHHVDTHSEQRGDKSADLRPDAKILPFHPKSHPLDALFQSIDFRLQDREIELDELIVRELLELLKCVRSEHDFQTLLRVDAVHALGVRRWVWREGTRPLLLSRLSELQRSLPASTSTEIRQRISTLIAIVGDDSVV